MFRLFIEQMKPQASTRVLDVGVTSDSTQPESNYFEKLYPYPSQISCVGTEDGSHLMREFPGLKYLQVVSGQPLPYPDRSFDVVFSNAVVEHVGSREQQRAFLTELLRVSKNFFITTPNRWLPVEHHTGLPFLHFLPPAVFRNLIRGTKYSYWSNEENLNILTRSAFAGLFPPSARVTVKTIRLFGLPSNLVAFGSSAAAR